MYYVRSSWRAEEDIGNAKEAIQSFKKARKAREA
jgi:hypothetical protein